MENGDSLLLNRFRFERRQSFLCPYLHFFEFRFKVSQLNVSGYIFFAAWFRGNITVPQSFFWENKCLLGIWRKFHNCSSVEKTSESHPRHLKITYKMALTKVTLQTSQLVAVKEDTADWKVAIKCLVDNATARNMVDLLLVITILVLLGIAAPIIRGDHCGELFLTVTVG